MANYHSPISLPAHLNPLAVQRWDNPETVRFRKYVTGSSLLLHVVDIEVGRTRKKLLWERGKVRLYKYEGARQKRHRVPVLIVYALILRPYILDLTPSNSLVRYLIESGFEVFLLDFGVPGKSKRDLPLGVYVGDYLRKAIERTTSVARSDDLTIIGHCMGGTLAAVYAATQPPIPPKNLILLAAPIDFTPGHSGLTRLWTLLTRQRQFRLDEAIQPALNVSREIFFLAQRGMDAGLAAVDRTVVPDVLQRIIAPNPKWQEWLAVCKWVDDGIPYLGKPLGQWLRQFYQENRLTRGEFELGGQRADLAAITCPVLNIAGVKDAITPIAQTRATTDFISSSDKRFFVVDAGHLGMIVGPAGRQEMWPGMVSWLAPRSG